MHGFFEIRVLFCFAEFVSRMLGAIWSIFAMDACDDLRTLLNEHRSHQNILVADQQLKQWLIATRQQARASKDHRGTFP